MPLATDSLREELTKMDRQKALQLLDVVSGADKDAAIRGAEELASDVWPLEVAAGIKNCRDVLAGKWGSAGPGMLRVSINTLREQM